MPGEAAKNRKSVQAFCKEVRYSSGFPGSHRPFL